MNQPTFKGTPVRLKGTLPLLQSKVPDFTLVDSELKDYHLKDFAGKKVILSVVPSLDTPVCALSAKKFNELFSQHPEWTLVFVSADLPFAQKRICGSENLSYTKTLSMLRSKKFAEDYGVLIEEGPLAGLCARAVFVLDEEGRLVYRELVSEITHEPDYEKAIQSL